MVDSCFTKKVLVFLHTLGAGIRMMNLSERMTVNIHQSSQLTCSPCKHILVFTTQIGFVTLKAKIPEEKRCLRLIFGNVFILALITCKDSSQHMVSSIKTLDSPTLHLVLYCLIAMVERGVGVAAPHTRARACVCEFV